MCATEIHSVRVGPYAYDALYVGPKPRGPRGGTCGSVIDAELALRTRTLSMGRPSPQMLGAKEAADAYLTVRPGDYRGAVVVARVTAHHIRVWRRYSAADIAEAVREAVRHVTDMRG